MRKLLFISWLSYLSVFSVNATHNRAGEITFRQISAYTYEFTITTFTYTLSPVDRDTVNVLWGDNTSSAAPRVQRIELPDYYRKNVYVIRHTFPGPGVYRVVMQDPTRNLGVINIPNSVRVFFSVETTLMINPQVGENNTPVLLNYPLDKAAVGRKFVHNPGAFDADGDSLSYKLTQCTKEMGRPIENYSFPKASNSLKVDSIKGDLIWDSPVDTGKYNIAMNIEEWRKGVKIGNIERDMQVEVHQSDNHPPVNPKLDDICIEAGKRITITFTVKDTDNDNINVIMYGGPFLFTDTARSAKFTQVAAGPGYTTVRFTWQTGFADPRLQPYTIVIKSTDNYAKLKLVDISSFQIKVMAPAPKNLTTNPGNNSISLKWSKSPCPGVVGYEIYRASGQQGFMLDSCSGGLPVSSIYSTSNPQGYKKVGVTKSLNDTTFLDNNQGQSLSLGINYCYRIVAVLTDGLRSYPSGESCTLLQPGSPSLTSVSVTKIDPSAGEIFVSWVKPHIDTLKTPAPGPYEYRIYRTNNLSGSNFSLINTFQTSDLSDTTYTDTNINTVQFPYNYKVELYNNTPGNRFLIGTPETASSMYPDLYPEDNKITIKFAKNIPWINTSYTIYRQNLQTSAFDSIGYAETGEYIDKGLKNGQMFNYRIKSNGYRRLNNINYNTVNWSHINGIAPLDTTRPCAPILKIDPICDSSLNVLKWRNSNKSCADDVIKYTIYFSDKIGGQLMPVATIDNNQNDTIIFRHKPSGGIAGCYAVTAIDSFNNESFLPNGYCVDACKSKYQLPNYFTPNNDGLHDLFISYNPGNYVKQVNMRIFNRWGKLVFQTSDPAINWDGRDMNTKRLVSSGVYYYICDIYEPRLTGIYMFAQTDFIYVYTTSSGKPLNN
jgi:gliding motility-associated-like protein